MPEIVDLPVVNPVSQLPDLPVATAVVSPGSQSPKPADPEILPESLSVSDPITPPEIKDIEDPKYIGQAIKIGAKLLIKIKLEAKKSRLSVREEFNFLTTHMEYEKVHSNKLNANYTRLGLEFNLALDHR